MHTGSTRHPLALTVGWDSTIAPTSRSRRLGRHRVSTLAGVIMSYVQHVAGAIWSCIHRHVACTVSCATQHVADRIVRPAVGWIWRQHVAVAKAHRAAWGAIAQPTNLVDLLGACMPHRLVFISLNCCGRNNDVGKWRLRKWRWRRRRRWRRWHVPGMGEVQPLSEYTVRTEPTPSGRQTVLV
eukprot:SAG31_NODE_2953_length_4866_cov_7.809104_6_plen_183_part_00